MEPEGEKRGTGRQEPITVGPPATPASEGTRSDHPCDKQEQIDELRQRERETHRLSQVIERINQGVSLDEILTFIYREMRQVIPYDRIGLALTDRQLTTVRSHWVRSERRVLLQRGYKAPLEGSTLMEILRTGRPRIINDLPAYLESKPHSHATRLIVSEGHRSSLTCPLIVRGRPAGFIFFTSTAKNTYSNVHVGFFRQIAGQLSATLEKGRLYTQLARRKAIIERQNRAMTRELELASRVQQALIPSEPPQITGIDIAYEYRPAAEVGGDIVDLIPLGRDRLFVFLGDAMGHGVAAALVMGAVKTALQTAVRTDSRPDKVLTRLNQDLGGLFPEHFVTAVCCLVDPHQREVQLALAGHDKPLWFRAQERRVVQEGKACLPLGVKMQTEYELETLRLGAGDALIFSTDGILEAYDRNEREYGWERLRNRATQDGALDARCICSAVMEDLHTHRGKTPLDDDVALVVLKL
jgi:serine phosphatase RsbU (regulator of sigma subunit)